MMAGTVASQTVSFWPMEIFYVAQATYDAARSSNKPSPSRELRWEFLQTKDSRGKNVIQALEVYVGGQSTGPLHEHFRIDEYGTKNLAEYQAFAWALSNLDVPVVFVTADKLATVEALAELGRSKVCHPFEFWNEMLRESLISESEWNDLCDRLLDKDKSLRGIPWRFQTPLGSGNGGHGNS